MGGCSPAEVREVRYPCLRRLSLTLFGRFDSSLVLREPARVSGEATAQQGDVTGGEISSAGVSHV